MLQSFYIQNPVSNDGIFYFEPEVRLSIKHCCKFILSLSKDTLVLKESYSAFYHEP